MQIKKKKKSTLSDALTCRPKLSSWIYVSITFLFLGLVSLRRSNITNDEKAQYVRNSGYIEKSKVTTPLKSLEADNHTTDIKSKGMTLSLRGKDEEVYDYPQIGFGTCCRPTAKGNEIYSSTLIYLQSGGRHIDTAMAYRNHQEIARAIKASNIPRSEIWLTSKIAVGKVRGSQTSKAIDSILEELETEYLDLLLIHTSKVGKNECVKMWEQMIEARNLGKIRTIGVSNFNKQEILDLEEETGVLPSLNEIQYHPWTPTEWKEFVEWQQSVTIHITAYNSLGGSRFRRNGGISSLPSSSSYVKLINEIQSKHEGVSEIHILLKWALQKGVAVIPGATSREHIIENLNIPSDFVLSDEEMKNLEDCEAPDGWWDSKRGPVKNLGEEEAPDRAWKDHTITT